MSGKGDRRRPGDTRSAFTLSRPEKFMVSVKRRLNYTRGTPKDYCAACERLRSWHIFSKKVWPKYASCQPPPECQLVDDEGQRHGPVLDKALEAR